MKRDVIEALVYLHLAPLCLLPPPLLTEDIIDPSATPRHTIGTPHHKWQTSQRNLHHPEAVSTVEDLTLNLLEDQDQKASLEEGNTLSLDSLNKTIMMKQSQLTLFRPMAFSIQLHTMKSGWSIVYIEGQQFQKKKKKKKKNI